MTDPDGIRRYLAELERGLRGTERFRRETLDELRAHILDIVDREPGQRVNVEELRARLGDPIRLATDLNREEHLRQRRKHRRSLALVSAALTVMGSISGVATLAVVRTASTDVERAFIHQREPRTRLDLEQPEGRHTWPERSTAPGQLSVAR